MEKPSFVTNRTDDDVKRWKSLRDKGWHRMTENERKEWLGEIETTPAATKGMYTHVDLNRVEKAVELISLRLNEWGYGTKLNVKTDWTYRDTFSKEDIERYLYNISALREFYIVFQDTPNAPNIDAKLDYKLANDIEKILSDVYDIADKLVQHKYYVGEIILGEV